MIQTPPHDLTRNADSSNSPLGVARSPRRIALSSSKLDRQIRSGLPQLLNTGSGDTRSPQKTPLERFHPADDGQTGVGDARVPVQAEHREPIEPAESSNGVIRQMIVIEPELRQIRQPGNRRDRGIIQAAALRFNCVT